VIKLWKFALVVMVTSHWLACLWVLLSTLQKAECNWVNAYFGQDEDACEPLDVHVSNWQQYIAALCARPTRDAAAWSLRAPRSRPC
jgi:hypothetical protein